MLIDEGLEILDEEDCMRLLATSTLGRIGVTVSALPAIFPVNFHLVDGAIVFRTGHGTKLSAATHGSVVAFECDESDRSTGTGWSVLALGTAERVTDPGEVTRLERLGIKPWAGGRRDTYVRIPIRFVSGRRIVPAAPVGPRLLRPKEGL